MKKPQIKVLFFYFITCALFFSAVLICYGDQGGEDADIEPIFKKVILDKKIVKNFEIKTEKIKEELVSEKVKASGKIEEIPKNSFLVNSPVVGKIVEVHVDLGTKVKAGQALASIQSTQVSELAGEVSKLEAELELAQNTFEREKSLFEKGISAKKELDLAKSNLSSTESRLSALKSNLNLLSEGGVQTKAGLFEIKAKKSGIIAERNLTIGQVVQPGDLLFKIIDPQTVWVNIDIYEKDASKVKMGQKVIIIPDGLNEIFLEGKINYISSVINNETRTLPVKAEIKNPTDKAGDYLLQVGAFVQAVIHTNYKKSSIVIPRSAIVDVQKDDKEVKHKHIVYVRREMEDEGQSFVFAPRKIVVESHDSNLVEVLSGLTSGDEIVTEGGYQLQFAKGSTRTNECKTNGLNYLVFIVVVILALLTIFIVRKKIVKK